MKGLTSCPSLLQDYIATGLVEYVYWDPGFYNRTCVSTGRSHACECTHTGKPDSCCSSVHSGSMAWHGILCR